MQLTKRSKLLIGAAALVAAYVLFGPTDAPPAVPAQATSATHTHRTVPAVTAPQTLHSLAALAHRVASASAADALFAAHSWYVAPPPPPQPVAVAPSAPPKPVAPPLPYAYMGSYAPEGAQVVFFLTRGDRVYDVHLGDTLDDTYSVDGFANGILTMTYKPLNQQQQLITEVHP